MPIHTIKVERDDSGTSPREWDNLGVIVGPRDCRYATEETDHINPHLWAELSNLAPNDPERAAARIEAIRGLADIALNDDPDAKAQWCDNARETSPEDADADACAEYFDQYNTDSFPDDDLIDACESVGIYCLTLETDRGDSGRFLVSSEKNRKNLGTPLERVEKCLEAERDEYTNWAQGNVYGFTIEDENGEYIDSCWGFISDDAGELFEMMSGYMDDEYHDALRESIAQWGEGSPVEVSIMTLSENPAC
jgi:hypothetical protein